MHFPLDDGLSYNLIVLSLDPDANNEPFGWKATALTHEEWSFIVRIHSPLDRLQHLTVSSFDPEMITPAVMASDFT